MSKELETVALWRDGGGGLWMGRSGLERPWNWLTGTDASPDDLLLGGSRKVEEPFGRIDPDDVRPAADLSLVVNDPVTGEPVEPDLMALLRDGCFDFDRSRETPEWQGFWRSERGMVVYRDASGFVRRWTPGHGLGAELVSPAKRGAWFDVPDASLAKLAGQGCRV